MAIESSRAMRKSRLHNKRKSATNSRCNVRPCDSCAVLKRNWSCQKLADLFHLSILHPCIVHKRVILDLLGGAGGKNVTKVPT